MRSWRGTALLCSALLVGMVVGARADEEPVDPTRGQWDSFLDPLRDVEDDAAAVLKSLDDQTKVKAGIGISEAWFWNFNNPATGINTLHSLDPDHDSWDHNLTQFSLSRPSEGWIPGFGMKLNLGRVAKRAKSDWDGDALLEVGDDFEKNSFDVEELYLQYTLADTGTPLDGLSLKAGKFVTLLGAEVIEPWLNPNFSRSFLFGFSIPFTHTGALVSYPLTDKVTMTGGIVQGWDNVGQDINHSPSFMGNVTFAACDQFTIAANGIYGPEGKRVGPKRGVADLVATIKPHDQLTFVLNYDYGHEANVINSQRPATWQGIAGVASVAVTPRTTVAARGEWFEDSDGARTGVAQGYWETTLSLKYLITQHVYWRGEYRHDEARRTGVFLAGRDKFTSGQDLLGFEFGVTY